MHQVRNIHIIINFLVTDYPALDTEKNHQLVEKGFWLLKQRWFSEKKMLKMSHETGQILHFEIGYHCSPNF